MSGLAKNRGLMMHIAHLPAERSFIGQFLDPQTDKFIDFLYESRQTHWIINPLTPLSEDLSPYKASSRYDRNKYMINLNKLIEDEYGNLLKASDLPDDIPSMNFTLDMLQAQKDPRFELAHKKFEKIAATTKIKKEYAKFCKQQGESWLDNNSIYEGIVSFINNNNFKKVYSTDWRSWQEDLKFLPEALIKAKATTFAKKIELLKKVKVNGKKLTKKDFTKIEQFRFEQFLFNKQFKAFKNQLKAKGIYLFVDLAYAVDFVGKDVWSKKDIVELDPENNYDPLRMTGVMPEPAYPFTQMWGQAVWNYNSKNYWDYQEDSMKYMLSEGCVRLDHFGGLVNRGAIPAKIDINGEKMFISEAIAKGFAPIDIWDDAWLEDVYDFKNSKGENLIDMYLRVAEELGLKPEDTFIVEDLGGVCSTDTFLNFMAKYEDRLAGLRLPVTFGIDMLIDGRKIVEEKINTSNPYLVSQPGHVEKIALLSGSHDPATTMEVVETLLTEKADYEMWNSPFHFREFCFGELKLWEGDLEPTPANIYNISMKILRWLYEKPAKHVHTTISDALGIYFRPNIPGDWNGAKDKYLMKPTAMNPIWASRFPKDFLNRDNENGINPGYKAAADKYIAMMQEYYPEPVV